MLPDRDQLHRRPLPAGRPPRALLAWEFGAGRTHIANLLGVAAHLRKAGVECLATLYEPRFATEFAALGIATVQNYVWPARRRAAFAWQERRVEALGDVLANLGLADEETLGAAIAHYDGLFSLFDPDIVLAENAFGAILAARGRLPAIAFGNSACLPPIEGAGFALRLASPGPPSWPIETVCAGIGRGLVRAGREPLGILSDILRIDGVYPFGPPAFDLYQGTRRAPILSPHLPDLPRPIVTGSGEELFVYLHGFVQARADIMQVLGGLGTLARPVRLYIPELIEANRAALSSLGLQVVQKAVPVPELLRIARCVVHHGGTQLTSACLAAGIPQVILAKELDNELCARLVAEGGLGMGRHITHATADWIAESVRRVVDDAEMKRRCLARAPDFARWMEDDPTRFVAEAVLSRIGARDR